MRGFLLVVTVLAACGDDAATPDAGAIDAEIPDAMAGPDADPAMPGTLRQTGLYSDWDDETLADGVMAFSPGYQLWSDGATKRRWISLPAGSTIDSSDMNYWVFPEGTKLWKEFSRDGVRIETRLLMKNGPDAGDWYRIAYAWNDTQDEAVAVPLGERNALGTEHDIPGQSDCGKCHRQSPDWILGFSAILLDHAAVNGEIALADVVASGWLSDPPTGSSPYFTLPGTDVDHEALGYMHSNCGGCHNPHTDISSVQIRLRLEVESLQTVAGTTTGMTTIGVAPNLGSLGGTSIIEPNNPAASEAYLRFTTNNPSLVMPPLGHEVVDPAGEQLLEDWINSL